ncbi:hypothetical protein MLD38_023160 [Melastoma candidum]|uniref:Uncharacterized protein n=1 Tax=Melastoma candidum TaxID=119954 RepID=A0ACB9QLL3_9MYRT|nr:hypothetical protein MLD38_023160 [Melastoma candidum]
MAWTLGLLESPMGILSGPPHFLLLYCHVGNPASLFTPPPPPPQASELESNTVVTGKISSTSPGRRYAPRLPIRHPIHHLVGAFAVVLLLRGSPTLASESDHKYQQDEAVILWVLGGNELIESQLEDKVSKKCGENYLLSACSQRRKCQTVQDAIENNYWLSSLSVLLGELHLIRTVTAASYGLYTPHKTINIRYNNNQVGLLIAFYLLQYYTCYLSHDNPKPLEVGKTLDMTYAVKWHQTNVSFSRRFDVYLELPFFEHQDPLFSIFNSFMMVIFLTGLVSMILMRTLRNVYAKYAREDDDLETLLTDASSRKRDVSEESGWKLVHGDVFRPPRSLALISALVGQGRSASTAYSPRHFACNCWDVIRRRGAIVTTFILCYAFTSFISGYVSGWGYTLVMEGRAG